MRIVVYLHFVAQMVTGPLVPKITRHSKWPHAICTKLIRVNFCYGTTDALPPIVMCHQIYVYHWLANQCNAGKARLITQNIDGLDARAGNDDYVCIHGRLDMMTAYDDQDVLHAATTGVPNIFVSSVLAPRLG